MRYVWGGHLTGLKAYPIPADVVVTGKRTKVTGCFTMPSMYKGKRASGTGPAAGEYLQTTCTLCGTYGTGQNVGKLTLSSLERGPYRIGPWVGIS